MDRLKDTGSTPVASRGLFFSKRRGRVQRGGCVFIGAGRCHGDDSWLSPPSRQCWDGWQSGLMRTPGKRVCRKATGVRIPPHPPVVSGRNRLVFLRPVFCFAVDFLKSPTDRFSAWAHDGAAGFGGLRGVVHRAGGVGEAGFFGGEEGLESGFVDGFHVGFVG